MSINYHEYIRSEEWRRKADAAKKRAGYRCQLCNTPDSMAALEAHHRTYERLGNEEAGDITVLCDECHDLFERNKRSPRPGLWPALQNMFSKRKGKRTFVPPPAPVRNRK